MGLTGRNISLSPSMARARCEVVQARAQITFLIFSAQYGGAAVDSYILPTIINMAEYL